MIDAANNALALAIGDLFWITIVSGVLGLACCLMLRDRPLKSGEELRSDALAPGGQGRGLRLNHQPISHPSTGLVFDDAQAILLTIVGVSSDAVDEG